ncbi:MAG: hypothetical protein JEY96_00990 [Bacteroidales bacterium]|nr:hypothetical protein [Bacteroidales bacterium]
MKKIKYIIVFLLSIGLLNSCLIDNDTDLDKNEEGKNFFTFNVKQTSLAGIADGSEYTFKLQIALSGPTSMDVTSDLQAVIVADEASTAVEGTHYRIDNPTVTITKENNYLAELELTMITVGIVTPLDASPLLLLKVSNVTGSADVIADGKPITISLDYACPSFLAGDYDVVTTRGDGGVRYWSETITNIGVGKYLTEYVGTWDPPLNPDYGMVFQDVCDVISVPLQGLADMYSNDVWSHEPGSVDPLTGIITINYTIAFDSGDQTYSSVYTPVK